jgi:tRNA (guanine37-N1)-methyltransferase
MIKFDIITIFPNIFESYLKDGLISRAIKNKLISIKSHDLRKWGRGIHKAVDDRPFGGGFGMVLQVEPIYKAIRYLKSQIPMTKSQISKTKIILFTPRGKKFNQKIAYQLSKLDRIILICGRYEGVDERVAEKIADMELSIGDYDLMGGELPAMVLIESISRLIPGVLGKPEVLKERITKSKGFIEYPQYTRPDIFKPERGKQWKTPKVLLSGNHKEIQAWRDERKKVIEK